MVRALVVLLVGLISAGCLRSPADEPAPGVYDPWVDDDKLSAFRLDQCSGIVTSRPVPAATLDAQRPDGWERGTPTANVALDFHSCKRLMVGPFERGPLTIMFELHSSHTAPADCTNGDYTSSFIVNQIWLDDPEIAAWLANHSLNAKFAAFDWQSSEGPAEIVVHTLSFEGNSVRTSYQHSNSTRESDTDRLFWPTPRGVSYLDLHRELSFNGQFPRTFTGEFSNPLLYAQFAGPVTVGAGGFYESSSFDGAFHHFEGSECQLEVEA